jgi:hypothetical protein
MPPPIFVLRGRRKAVSFDELALAGAAWRERTRSSASSSPARRLRLCGASAVATRSPVPASPIIDSGRAPSCSA